MSIPVDSVGNGKQKNHLQFGKFGEREAGRSLEAQGYRILEANWRHKHLEVDFIAKDGGVMVFIEVKSRTSTAFGVPSSFVDKKKQQNLMNAAKAYLDLSGHKGDIRFDIVSVLVREDRKTDIEIIKDAFWGY